MRLPGLNAAASAGLLCWKPGLGSSKTEYTALLTCMPEGRMALLPLPPPPPVSAVSPSCLWACRAGADPFIFRFSFPCIKVWHQDRQHQLPRAPSLPPVTPSLLFQRRAVSGFLDNAYTFILPPSLRSHNLVLLKVFEPPTHEVKIP